MKSIIIYLSVLLLFLFVGLSPVYAGFEEGKAAYKQGDYETAFQEFKPLAEQGDASSQNILGEMYGMGRGIPQDYAEAFKWHKKAAEQGHARAQFNLGLIYGQGNGVTKNRLLSYVWFSLAAKELKIAVKYGKRVRSGLTREQITEAKKLVREFKVKSP